MEKRIKDPAVALPHAQVREKKQVKRRLESETEVKGAGLVCCPEAWGRESASRSRVVHCAKCCCLIASGKMKGEK